MLVQPFHPPYPVFAPSADKIHFLVFRSAAGHADELIFRGGNGPEFCGWRGSWKEVPVNEMATAPIRDG